MLKKYHLKKIYKSIDDKDNIPILLSGGTNSLSKELSLKTNVRVNGIAIGTYARDIIEQYIVHNDFFDNHNTIISCFTVAKKLVDVSNVN